MLWFEISFPYTKRIWMRVKVTELKKISALLSEHVLMFVNKADGASLYDILTNF